MSELGTDATVFCALLLRRSSSRRYSAPMAKPSGPAGRFTGKPVNLPSMTVSLLCCCWMTVPRMARSVTSGLLKANASSAGTRTPFTREYVPAAPPGATTVTGGRGFATVLAGFGIVVKVAGCAVPSGL